MKRQTPDERLMIAFYQAAQKAGDLFGVLAVQPIASTLGLKETAVKNIVKHLAQANFVKKVGESSIRLTEHGKKFVLALME